MNKKTLLIAGLAIVSTSVLNAQTQQWKPIFGSRKTNANVQKILQHQQPVVANKGTSIFDRLIGWSIYNAGVMADSAHYVYNSTSRGSNLDNTVINSYTDNGYDPISVTQSPYPLAVSRNAPTLKYDTGYVLYFINPPSTTDKYEIHINRGYTSNALTSQSMNINLHYMGQDNLFASKQQFMNNAADAPVMAHYFEDTTAAATGSFVPYMDGYFTYNGNNIVRDSLLEYTGSTASPSDNTIYSYDVNGNMTSSVHSVYNGIGYDAQDQYLYTYTSNNKLQSAVGQTSSTPGVWVNSSLDSFLYQGNNIVYNSTYEWSNNTSSWMIDENTRSYYNTQGNIDSQLTMSTYNSGNLAPDNKAIYTYTSFGHYDKLKSYAYNGTGYNTSPDAQFNMYYETINTAGVNSVMVKDLGASIYPNPAGNSLNIRFKDAPKGALNVRIYNTTGQLLQVTNFNNSTYAVPVNSLAPGNYIIEISNNEGAQRLQFAKL